ncbi:MAG: hypothetical protein NC097_03370 [Clostridium sp.]|nr:hypothetical protein [Prevotella sp.]MCM1428817.1 hypothetical protein [Clostridium sp.]MCM1475192.1 hypothetical protein [Muribaculaceae bacterium]
MELTHHHCNKHHAEKLCFKIIKLALHAASVAAAFLLVDEVHRVHKAIKERKE